MNMDIHRHTPTLTAFDGRGLEIKSVAYHRRQATHPSEARISRQVYAPSGPIAAAWDARQSYRSTRPNQAYTYSLSGQVLVNDSVDAGCRIVRYTQAGKPRERWDSRGTRWQIDYDRLLRPVAVHESPCGQHQGRVTDRFDYAASTPLATSRNQCGRLTRQDDEAGSLCYLGYALTGEAADTTRRFSISMATPDWPHALNERDRLLEPGEGAPTRRKFSPVGEILEQTDAAGHRQRSAYTFTGQLARLTLRTRDGIEKAVFHSMSYTASGQLESQLTANGIASRDQYDVADGRLLRRKAVHADHRVLQDLDYRYDPAGNIVRMEDRTQPPRFFDNQRVDGVATFTYDSLGQLIEATGRESAGACVQPDLPALGLNLGDTSQWVNYTQHYHYDASGNLTRLRHAGHQHYTRHLEVSDQSNRGLPLFVGHYPGQIDKGFDENGNLLKMEQGRSLRWSRQNQLHSVVLLARALGEDDTECYVYDGSGQRARKLRCTQAKGTRLTTEVRYLPGLELHADHTQRLEVVTLQAGHNTVRYLYWTAGKPKGIDNHQLRYGLGDHVNACALELDDQGRLISHEGYYPYGGTAWWAARSVVQASYKTLRYSGKERDASGLYYYGFRYYAPWLQRWISPDPAGAADGLNLYRMVGNSPLSAIDPNGLMMRNIVKGVGGVAYAGYQLSKKDDQPRNAPAAPQPTPLKTPGQLQADQWLDKSRQHIVEAKDKVTGAFSGRLAAAFHLARGEVPGVGAVAKGVEVTAQAAQFAAHGDVSQLDKTSLAKSAVVDTYNNLGSVIEATKKVAHTTAVAATLPTGKQIEVQDELHRRSSEATQGLATSVATGVAVAGALDTAAAIAPPGPIKLGLIGASFAWRATGVVHTAEELAKMADAQKSLISNEFGKDLNAQVTALNQQKRSDLMDRYIKRTA